MHLGVKEGEKIYLYLDPEKSKIITDQQEGRGLEMEEFTSSKKAKDWWNKKRIERTVNALRKNEMNALCFDTLEEAANHVLSMIPPGVSVGLGGSVTVREMGIVDELQKRGHEIIDHWQYDEADPKQLQMQKAMLTCDVFLTSTNAVTLDGALVNSDGSGNRVAAMIFGPKKVIVIAGVNKIVSTIDEGISRIRNVATPKNAQRKQLDAPCGQTGYCVNCKGPERRCRITTIIEKLPRKRKSEDFTVVLIGKNLGY